VREGDFMEHRGTDRERVAAVADALGVAYTKDRNPGTWIVGVPVHAWHQQVGALTAAGYDVHGVTSKA
jgi:hypothetical protein